MQDMYSTDPTQKTRRKIMQIVRVPLGNMSEIIQTTQIRNTSIYLRCKI